MFQTQPLTEHTSAEAAAAANMHWPRAEGILYKNFDLAKDTAKRKANTSSYNSCAI